MVTQILTFQTNKIEIKIEKPTVASKDTVEYNAKKTQLSSYKIGGIVVKNIMIRMLYLKYRDMI